MRNPEHTRQLIIETASILFNTKGYKSTSISDITRSAGITKGAIYKHFKDKSDLEKECLQSMTRVLFSNVSEGIRKAPDAEKKILSLLNYFAQYGVKSPFKGGCPLMNAAVEVDDSDPGLKKVVSNIFVMLHQGISKVIENGVLRGQLKADIDVSEYATLIYSSIEGAIMMMKATDDDKHLQYVITFLKRDLKNKLV